MRKLLCLLLLSLPALASPTPEELVTRLYRTHLKTQDTRQTLSQSARAFQPEFLEILNRAPAGADILIHTPGKLTDFAVEPASLWTTRAEVRVKLWTGDRLGQQKSVPQDVTFYLSDAEEGAGFQIQDIQFPGRPGYRVRESLSKATTP